jgi:hypothetical protein
LQKSARMALRHCSSPPAAAGTAAVSAPGKRPRRAGRWCWSAVQLARAQPCRAVLCRAVLLLAAQEARGLRPARPSHAPHAPGPPLPWAGVPADPRPRQPPPLAWPPPHAAHQTRRPCSCAGWGR